MKPGLQNPYFPSARRWGQAFGLCMAVAVGGGVLGLIPKVAAILTGAIGGTFCLTFWLSLWLTGHSLEGEMESFRQGKALDQWELSAEVYRSWWEEQRRAVTRGAMAVGAMLLLMGVLVGLMIWTDEDKPELGASVMAASLVVAATVALVVRWVLSGPGPRENESYTLWIGSDLALLNGQVRRWQGPGLRLKTVEAVDQPPRLRVHYQAAIKTNWVDQRVEFPAPSVIAAAAVAAQIEAARRD
jgi:hypothetical protein